MVALRDNGGTPERLPLSKEQTLRVTQRKLPSRTPSTPVTLGLTEADCSWGALDCSGLCRPVFSAQDLDCLLSQGLATRRD